MLRYFDRHGGEYLASSILQAVGVLLLIVVAVHLYRATKARNPDQQSVVLVMGVYGPFAFASSTMVRAIAIRDPRRRLRRAVSVQTERGRGQPARQLRRSSLPTSSGSRGCSRSGSGS